ncbi:MAG TPA: M23 family metallopeptidase [Gemmatimonadales bacterium]
MTPLHVIVALPIALAGLTGPARVEIETPAPPTLALIDSQRVLIYELHITSFARTPLELCRIEVLGRPAQTLAAYKDSALAALLQTVGGMHQAAHDAARLEPGQRVVAYLWLPMPGHGAVPDTLVNRVVFSPADSAASPEDETVAEQVVPVRRVEAVVLSPPLPEGIWLAGDGPSNDSPHRRALVALAGRTYIAQRFAIDWMLVGPNGDTHRGDATRNENYWGFDQPVFAVADGEVMEVVDSIPDHAPHVLPGTVTLANIAGNHIILRIAPHRYVLYAHLERGSMRVHPGERVRRGQTIAKLGDSGQTTAPHLHLHVADGNSVLGAEGVPWVLRSYEDLGSGSTFELNAHPDIRRERTLPGANEVVRWGGERP